MTNLYIPANRKFTFIRVFEDGSYETIDRYAFFEILKTTPNPQERVIPDFEAAIVYFVPASAGMAQAAVDLAREADRQKKRDASRYGCIYAHTCKCDGWKKNADGSRRCESCVLSRTTRTISLDVPVTDEDGEEDSFASTNDFASDIAIDAHLENECDKELLRAALATLPQADQAYIADRYRDGMNFSRLAEMYGLSDRTYASKKAARIEDRLKKAVKKILENE